MARLTTTDKAESAGVCLWTIKEGQELQAEGKVVMLLVVPGTGLALVATAVVTAALAQTAAASVR